MDLSPPLTTHCATDGVILGVTVTADAVSAGTSEYLSSSVCVSHPGFLNILTKKKIAAKETPNKIE